MKKGGAAEGREKEGGRGEGRVEGRGEGVLSAHTSDIPNKIIPML